MFSVYIFIDVIILFSDSSEGAQQTITNRPSTSSSSQGMPLVIAFSTHSLSLSVSLSLSLSLSVSLSVSVSLSPRWWLFTTCDYHYCR